MAINLLEEIKRDARWNGKDAFPSTLEWELEVNKWIVFIKNNGQLERFLPRLKDMPDKRDEALAEISTAYFISEIKESKIIKWEPKGVDNKTGEFTFTICDGKEVFCEVKSPGWEADIVRRNRDYTRLEKPKHMNGEARFFNNATDIRQAIEKAYPKLPNNTLTLLVIRDDLWVSLNDDLFGAKEALFYEKLLPPYTDTKENGCFISTEFENLSGMATLNVELSSKMKYCWKLYHNPHALNKFPDTFIKEWTVYEILF